MRYKGANITFIALHSSRLLKIHNKEVLRDECLTSCSSDMLYMPHLVYILYIINILLYYCTYTMLTI